MEKKLMPISTQLRKKERGFVLILSTVMLFVLLGFTGLAVDTGYLQWQRRTMQSAADAAAMGALRELELGRTNTGPAYDLTLAARNDAALNGFTDGVNNVTVTLNNPPVSGSFNGDSTVAQVIISRPYPTFFMGILGTTSVTISAQAQAQTTTSYGSVGGCIFALGVDPTSGANNVSPALSLENGATLYSSCSAISESTDPTEAFKMAGGLIWNMTSHNAHVAVVGGATMNGSATIMDTTVTPHKSEPPITGYTNPGDPLINVAAPIPSPTFTGGMQQSAPITYGTGHMATLSPGIYCDGITVSNTGGASLHLKPGIYVLAGGGLSLGSQAQIDGTGVAFYLTSSTGWGCPMAYPAGGMDFTGGPIANFSAPTSGPLCGMLFFQDRTISLGTTIKIVGSATSTFDGAIYFKKSTLEMAGNNSTNGYMVIVANIIKINGATKLGNNYSSLQNPNPYAPGSTGGGLVY